jgi:hypothetical protein
MRRLLPVISFVGLALVFGPVLVYLAGSLEKDTMSTIMLTGTVVWFASVPFWMGKNRT